MKTWKKIIKGIFAGIVLIFLLLLGIGLLLKAGILKNSPDEQKGEVKYQPINIGKVTDEEAIPDSKYYPTVQTALRNSNIATEAEQLYQKSMDEIIACFENENYISIYFKSVKDKNTECLTFAKFKKKLIDGEEKYTFLTSIPTEIERGSRIIGTLKDNIEDQLALSDYTQSINIDPENTRFVFGDCKSEEVYNLKVEGQEPSGIIPYETFGEKWYFWYFEDLESNVVGSQLEFTLE